MKVVGYGCLVGVVLVLAAVGAFLLWWNWVPLHKGAYVHANERIVSSVGAYPHARRVARYVEGYDGNDECLDICVAPSPTIGYRLELVYRVPYGTSPTTIIRWYRTRLTRDGWHRLREDDATPLLQTYARGDAEFEIDMQVVADKSRELMIAVDKNGTQNH